MSRNEQENPTYGKLLREISDIASALQYNTEHLNASLKKTGIDPDEPIRTALGAWKQIDR